ncbi:MAG: methyltransferase [Chloroflexi bacterium]|nr:methyltransferase [Chloroflexota bacterium]
MKPLPEVHIPFTGLYETLVQPILARMLLTGIELGVFDHLERPISAEALAGTIGTHAGNTALLLNGLVSMDVVVKKDGLYSNAPVARTFLTQQSPTYLGDFLAAHSRFWFAPLADNMTGLVRHGPRAITQPPLPGDPAAQHATLSLHYERAGPAQRIAALVSELPEFPAFRTMLDLGGGPGLICLAVVARHPSMKGTVFDLPAVTRIAETVIAEYGAQDRMNTVPGNYLADDIGSGYDLVLASATLNAAKGSLDSIMAKIRESMTPNGVLVSLHDGLTHEHTRPPIMVASILSTAMLGSDPAFDQGQIAGAMRRAGFRSVDSRTLETGVGPMDLDIARN